MRIVKNEKLILSKIYHHFRLIFVSCSVTWWHISRAHLIYKEYIANFADSSNPVLCVGLQDSNCMTNARCSLTTTRKYFPTLRWCPIPPITMCVLSLKCEYEWRFIRCFHKRSKNVLYAETHVYAFDKSTWYRQVGCFSCYCHVVTIFSFLFCACCNLWHHTFAPFYYNVSDSESRLAGKVNRVHCIRWI